jgi:heme/copper-type cytochrome/quinol oxidase subunit 1
MPKLTRWFVKASLIYFILALISGLLVAARDPLSLPVAISSLNPVYFHLIMVGWVAQLIFGIVFWMFPKYSSQKPRGSESLGWAAFWLINSGLSLRLIGEPLHSLNPQAGFGWILALSALLQWLAGMAFVFNTWSRVKER